MNDNKTAVEPQIRRLDRVLYGFKVTSHLIEDKLCNVTVTIKDEHGEVKSKSFRDVRLSSLLHWNLLNNEAYEVGKYYESYNTSSDWKSNPLQLISYTDDDGISTKHILACVSERNSLVRKDKDALGGITTEVIFRHHKKEYYRRYRNCEKR